MLREEVRALLKSNRIKLSTDLGQHFLVEEAVLEKIVERAALRPTDHVVEIGPGIGILTRELTKRARHVTAIEIDSTLIPLLREFVPSDEGGSERLTVIQGNALHVPLPQEPYKVVANIPYHITSPLLRHLFLESAVPPTSLTLLIQREVAETICDERSAGMLTILVGLFGSPRIETLVPPEAFLPPPKVESAVLQIDCFPESKADRETIEQVFRLTKIAFAGKRKMLRNTLGVLPRGRTALDESGITKTRRPHTLTIDEWITLARHFA